ncbi:MAG TPA: OB-fold nucleic acid binding domain-containing protein, partial [Anaerolineales bacterium]|nr:OB-fold nucleic acid binding domain-containing protein [Anaerolineales bacterium]
MQPSLEKLRKFFRLEHENGYSNSAIIGGLAKMLDFWEGEARADGINEEVIQAVVQRLRSYEGLSPQSRADALKGLWKRIGDVYPEAAQKTTPIPRPQVSESAPTRPHQPSQRPQQQQRSAPPPRSESAPGAKHSQTPAALNAPLTVLQGVGPKHAQTLESIGLKTLGDMLYYFPRRYEDYSQLKPIKSLWYGEQVTVIGTIQSVHTRPIRGGGATIIEAILGDGTGSLRLSWFNQPWMANRLKEGEQISVSGKVDQYLGRLVMNQPDWESLETESLHTNRIVPIYSLTAKITQKWLRNLMNQVVTYWAPAVVDSLPESVRSSTQMMSLGQALLQAHFPDTQESLKAARE